MFEDDLSRAIQLTLNAWRNNDEPLTDDQRQAIENFMRSPGSGPDGVGVPRQRL